METLTALPETIADGTTVAYTKTVADYPATDGWTLTLEIAGEKLLSVEADANGGDYDVTISAEQSATLTAGTYYFAEKVEKAGEVHRVGSGRVTVEPNLATALAGDLQSPNERMLKALNAVIESRLGTSTGVPKDVESYAIDGIAVTKIPLERLMTLRTQLSTTVARERRGGGIGRQYRYTFTGARNEQ